MRVQNQGDNRCRSDQPNVIQVVGAWIVSAGILHSAAIHDGAREAQAEGFADLVKPVARLIKWQISFERDDSEGSAEEDKDVALHHLQGHTFHGLAALHSHRYQEEAEHADQGRQRQQEGEVATGENPEYCNNKCSESTPHLEALFSEQLAKHFLGFLRILHHLLHLLHCNVCVVDQRRRLKTLFAIYAVESLRDSLARETRIS